MADIGDKIIRGVFVSLHHLIIICQELSHVYVSTVAMATVTTVTSSQLAPMLTRSIFYPHFLYHLPTPLPTNPPTHLIGKLTIVGFFSMKKLFLLNL
jgi:hypothetical protein